jgi:starvation-inducible DNA-binding protein
MAATDTTRNIPEATQPGGPSQPELHTLPGKEYQRFDQLRDLPLGLDRQVRSEVTQRLNGIFADTRILHDLYKKSHWNMRGATFYQLHLLMDEHAEQQEELIDNIAERIQTLGAIAAGDPRHVAELTSIPRAPDGAEDVPAMLTRLLRAHEAILVAAREVSDFAAEHGDPGTEDLLSSEVIPKNELQVWFVSEHLSHVPLQDTQD